MNCSFGRHTMALYPRQKRTFAFDVVFTFFVSCSWLDITVSQCDIELACNIGVSQCGIEVWQYNVSERWSSMRHSNYTFSILRLAFDMLSCHFVLVSLFNSRHVWMDAWLVHRWNTLYFAGSIQYGEEWISSSPQHSRSDNNSPRKHDRSISIMETMCFHIEWSPQK